MQTRQNIKKTIQSLRGMQDIVNEESDLFTYFIENASKIAKKYGFSYIKTPLLEETALFKRSVGESSDIVNKEMYQFIDKGENDVCLRPEGTAGVVRHFIQKKLDKAGGVYRWFYHGAMFRYERPQKGRLREFHQFGCEVFAVNSVYEDANIIMLICEILEFFGIKYKLQLNSLGCTMCMPKYKESLVKHILTFKDKLCEDCNKRLLTNPIRILDCKNETCQNLLQSSPKITDNLCELCNSDFEKLKEILNFINLTYEINSNLVRGLDYYNKTAFEFVSDEIGSQSAIAGGGRYDRLVEFLGGKSTPAIGFAIGIQRLLSLIKMQKQKEDFIYIGALDENSLNKAFKIGIKKRKYIKTHIEYTNRSFAKHFAIAEKLNCNIIALIGENELKNNTIFVKNITTKEEKNIALEEFLVEK